MTNPLLHQSATNARDLLPHWLICAAMLVMLIVYNVICHVWADDIRLHLETPQRELIRSILYGVAIILFPLTNLIRHILLRLNQTMPGEKSARQRYLLTVIITQILIEIVSLFGLVMFILGDDFNTLYIFSVMGALGIFLHRPKPDEYEAIVQALLSKSL